MGRKAISEEVRAKVIKMYKNNFSHETIANVLGISTSSICLIVRQEIIRGGVNFKRSSFGKPKTPNGQGKKYIKKGKYNPVNKKLNEEQEKELLKDYFEKDMTYKQVMQKYGLWQQSIKIIVDKAVKAGLYSAKGKGNKKRRIMAE